MGAGCRRDAPRTGNVSDTPKGPGGSGLGECTGAVLAGGCRYRLGRLGVASERKGEKVREMIFDARGSDRTYQIDGFNPVLVSSAHGYKFAANYRNPITAFYGAQWIGRVDYFHATPRARVTTALTLFHRFLVGESADEVPPIPTVRLYENSLLYEITLNATPFNVDLQSVASKIRIYVTTAKAGATSIISLRDPEDNGNNQYFLDLSVAGNTMETPGEVDARRLSIVTTNVVAPQAVIRIQAIY